MLSIKRARSKGVVGCIVIGTCRNLSEEVLFRSTGNNNPIVIS